MVELSQTHLDLMRTVIGLCIKKNKRKITFLKKMNIN